MYWVLGGQVFKSMSHAVIARLIPECDYLYSVILSVFFPTFLSLFTIK